jgi:hypothetical protein
MVLFCFVCRHKKLQILKGTFTTVTGEKMLLEYMFHKSGKDFTQALYIYKYLQLLEVALVHKTS